MTTDGRAEADGWYASMYHLAGSIWHDGYLEATAAGARRDYVEESTDVVVNVAW